MSNSSGLQEWYKKQCNGEWEQQSGVSIVSVDNPGWWVRIDLTGTPLENKPFGRVSKNVSLDQIDRISKGLEPDMCDRGPDWLLCQVKDRVFDGAGDPGKLDTILALFSGLGGRKVKEERGLVAVQPRPSIGLRNVPPCTMPWDASLNSVSL